MNDAELAQMWAKEVRSVQAELDRTLVELQQAQQRLAQAEKERDGYKADAGELAQECRKLNEECDGLEQRLAQAEKVVGAAKPFADGGIEVFTASDGYPAMRERDSSSLRAALAEWEGDT